MDRIGSVTVDFDGCFSAWPGRNFRNAGVCLHFPDHRFNRGSIAPVNQFLGCPSAKEGIGSLQEFEGLLVTNKGDKTAV
jgi:hypothetical protein